MQTALTRPVTETMFPKTTLCLWRDAHDPEQIVIGSVTRIHTPTGSRKRYTTWLTCHLDALLYLGDAKLLDRVREAQADEFPLSIELNIAIKE